MFINGISAIVNKTSQFYFSIYKYTYIYVRTVHMKKIGVHMFHLYY